MLRNADLRKEGWFNRHNLFRRVPAVKLAQQRRDSLHDRRIGICLKNASAVQKRRLEPKLGEAAFYPIVLGFARIIKWRVPPPAIHRVRDALLRILDPRQVSQQRLFLFRQCHQVFHPLIAG